MPVYRSIDLLDQVINQRNLPFSGFLPLLLPQLVRQHLRLLQNLLIKLYSFELTYLTRQFLRAEPLLLQ